MVFKEIVFICKVQNNGKYERKSQIILIKKLEFSPKGDGGEIRVSDILPFHYAA